MSKYTSSITIDIEVDSPQQHAELLTKAMGIGPVSMAILRRQEIVGLLGYAGNAIGGVPGLTIGAGSAPTSGQVAEQAAQASAQEANSGKGTRTRAKKTEEPAATATTSGSGSSGETSQNASPQPAATETASQSATPPADTAPATTDAKPAGDAPATVEQLRAAASEKIAADAGNRVKVHAIIKEFSADKAEPAMSKIPDDQKAAALKKLKEL
jgi:hypothetical protein